VYYVSHVLTGPELRYLLVEKFAYAWLIASRKLCPYFESHPITVLTLDRPTLAKHIGKIRELGKNGEMGSGVGALRHQL